MGDETTTLREDMDLVGRTMGPITCSAQMFRQLAKMIRDGWRRGSPSPGGTET